MICQLTSWSEKIGREFLLAMIDVQRLARQMKFWMTCDYIPHVMANKIPENIYEDGAEIIVELRNIRRGTFSPHIGFSIDRKNPDLGPVNGQEPIKECNKLLYWMVNAIVIAYLQNNLTRIGLYNFFHEKDNIKAEEISEEIFSHLPPKEYHGLMFSLTKRKLVNNQVKPAEQKQLLLKAYQHKREYNAAIIQRFWRSYNKISAVESCNLSSASSSYNHSNFSVNNK